METGNKLLLSVLALFVMLIGVVTVNAEFFTVTYVEPTLANNSNTSNGWLYINVTLNDTTVLRTAWAKLGTNVTNMTMTNTTEAWYVNLTIPVTTVNDTLAGQWNNYTVTINHTGNYTYGTFRMFKKDTIAPTLSAVVSPALANNTTHSWLGMSFTVNDNTTQGCYLNVFDNSNTLYQYGSANTSTDQQPTACTIRYAANSTVPDGNLTLRILGNDSIGRNVTQDFPMLQTTLRANSWNFIGYGDSLNLSLKTLIETLPDATQATVFDNTAQNKTYTTYQKSLTQVNNNSNATAGGVLGIYTTASFTLLRNQTSFNTSLSNVSLQTGGWNLLSVYRTISMNETMFMDVNSTGNTSITQISIFNVTSGYWVSCIRSLSLCTGNPNTTDPTTMNINQGYGVFALTNANLTLNRSVR